MNKVNDSIIIAFIAGSIGTLIQMVISWSLYLLDIINQNPSILHARLLTSAANPNTGEIILGTFGNFAAGLFAAIILVYILKYTGTDFALIKGGFLGAILAMLQFYILTRLFKDPTKVTPSTITQYHLYIVYH